jgi:phosphate/phosphite/phosphonate ABC transporter binding protein
VGNIGPNRVYLNDGTGIFTDSGQSIGDAYTWALDIGDLDGDQDLDVFIGSAVGPNSVLFNIGNGTFTDSGQMLGGEITWSVTLADLDNDGDLDAATGNHGPNKIWFNDGEGFFEDSVPPITLLLPYWSELPYEDFVDNANLLAGMLSDHAGREVNVVVPEGDWTDGQNAAISGMQSGDVDLALMSWPAYFVAYDSAGAQPGLNIVRFGAPFYTSQILTYSGSGVADIEDLASRPLCWVDGYSTSGYIVPSLMLMVADVDPDTTATYYGSHNQVVWELYGHNCDGGATYVDVRTAAEFPEDVMEMVFPIAISPTIPNDGFAFRGGLSEAARTQLIDAILAVAGTPEGDELLHILIDYHEGMEGHDFNLYQGLYDLIVDDVGYTPQYVWDTYYNQ